MAWRDIDIGAVSAYAVAVEQGYKGTEEQWAMDQAQAGANGALAKQSAETAVSAAEAAQKVLESLEPNTQQAITDIQNESRTQRNSVTSTGDVQNQRVLDTGAEQSRALDAQGATERKKVVAAGDEQVARVQQAGIGEVETIVSTGESQVDAISAKGAEAVVAVQTEQATAISAVQTESTAQQTAIENKGQEQLDKIPEVTELAADVSTLKNEIADKINNASLYDIDCVRKSIGENLWSAGDLEFNYDGTKTWKFVSAAMDLTAGIYTLVLPNINLSSAGFVMAEDANGAGNAYISKAKEIGAYVLTIPDDGTYSGKLYIRMQVSMATAVDAGLYYVRNIKLYAGDVSRKIIPEELTGVDGVKSHIAALTAPRTRMYNQRDSMGRGESLSIQSPPNTKYHQCITFDADVTAMGSLTIGHGRTEFSARYVTIDATTVKAYQYLVSSAQTTLNVEHGLNIADHITVLIEGKESGNDSIIRIVTPSGSFEAEITFPDANGVVYAQSDAEGGASFTNCKLAYYSPDWYKDTIVCADSYADYWPKYAYSAGFANYNLDAYSGRGSINALKSVKTLMDFHIPSKIIWCMGMNDGDNETAVNANWQSTITELQAICAEKDIELILCTIPNVPSRNHTYKNAIVRSSGYRYIDLCAALGADTNTAWHDGLQNTDKVHPSDPAGAQYIAGIICAAVPELYCE